VCRRAATSASSSSGDSRAGGGAGWLGVIVACAGLPGLAAGSGVCLTVLPAALRAQ
jgi:hypothetical protein